MGHFEQMLSSETQFTGHIFTVTLDQVRLEDGTTAPRRSFRPRIRWFSWSFGPVPGPICRKARQKIQGCPS